VNKGEQRLESVGCPDNRQSVGFISACGVAFIVSVAATVYFCRSMCCEMEMPGGWTMSMMWTRMHGQTWAASATSFLLMWLAMMVAMMMPSALPMFLNTRHSIAETKVANTPTFLALVASGYFTVWLAVGAGIYGFGIAFATAATRWESFSRAVPVLSGASLIAAGLFQFTRWKMSGLLCCRSALGCAASCPERDMSFLLGCKQGATCCICSTTPMMTQLALGVMNLLVMVAVAIVIAAEKLPLLGESHDGQKQKFLPIIRSGNGRFFGFELIDGLSCAALYLTLRG
jgi:predicted metal-binding membrane protein